ncbi:glycerophosphodiester phosphodiesterase [Alkalicoccus chagannorensis]|uniref:glycerophosphodiester phosphodiesterase n=1 Tax=Alkalicoccus chagannorensis TaxID=427072 RepID=UPI0004233075|nr:glycerophosphodiester phosphodiesterase family protein [Alkalicoccus chagannorensis]
MHIIGHRGFKKKYPENTMRSFREAAEFPIEGIECDVHMSSDFVPVIHHDATLERTTDGSGLLAMKTYEELRTLDAGSMTAPAFAGEKIPSLAETADFIKEKNLWFHLELKEQKHVSDAYFISTCLEMLRERMMLTETVISTFCHRYLREIKKQQPLVETAMLTKTPFRRGRKYANKNAADGIHIRHGIQSSMYYKAWRKQSIVVRAYHVRKHHEYFRCRQAGINGIITDDVEKMTKLRF